MDSSGARSRPTAGEPKQGRIDTGSHPVIEPGSPRVQADQLVGRYRLLFPIAAGGMAEVWAAKPDGGGFARAVAIKLVRPEFAVDAEYARMFIDEAVVASAIRHPNICETHELGREEKLLFMVLEWVAGDSLSGLLRGSELNPLPLEIAARVCAEACAGLHAAHEAHDPEGNLLGIVHRDVSPPNILVSVHGHVKVSDFGIAKARNQLHARTRTGEIKGKLAYIPPEQVLGQGVDRRADIYAMGCVLYVSTLGLRPFGGGVRAVGNIVRGNYRKPRDLQADYPEELERIVARALAVNRDERYQTAEEMRYELEQWLLTRPTPTKHGDVGRLVRERLSDERKKMIDVLFNAGRTIPDALAKRYLAHADKNATPTATSGIVLQPKGLAPKKASAVTVRPPSKQPLSAQPAATSAVEAITATAAPLAAALRSSTTNEAPAPRRYSEDDETLLRQPTEAPAPPLTPQVEERVVAVPETVIVTVQPEITEMVVRRMRPRFLPVLILLVLGLCALIWFVLSHP
ncbi:MAG: serine/threonine-protein kinase [Myxococcales bacterium]